MYNTYYFYGYDLPWLLAYRAAGFLGPSSGLKRGEKLFLNIIGKGYIFRCKFFPVKRA